LRDERNIHHLTRMRNFNEMSGAYRIKGTRREMRERMVREGFVFLKSPPKGRYVGFYAPPNLKRELRAALKWDVLPYPRRLLVGIHGCPANRWRRPAVATSSDSGR
jgi:hypothetical protein